MRNLGPLSVVVQAGAGMMRVDEDGCMRNEVRKVAD